MNTKLWGLVLIVLGIIGLITGTIQGHLFESAAAFCGYLLPGVIGVLLLVLNKTGGRK